MANYRLELSDSAEKDFQNILFYTLQEWGERQMLRYAEALDTALIEIEKNPLKGKKDFPPHRFVRAKDHYIFYRIDKKTIIVTRILHGAMHFLRHLHD